MIPLGGGEFILTTPTHTSTGTHPNEVFGGAYNFCKAKFSDSVLIDKCAIQLTQANTLKSTHANTGEDTARWLMTANDWWQHVSHPDVLMFRRAHWASARASRTTRAFATHRAHPLMRLLLLPEWRNWAQQSPALDRGGRKPEQAINKFSASLPEFWHLVSVKTWLIYEGQNDLFFCQRKQPLSWL